VPFRSSFRPNFVVPSNFLFGAMFARPGWGHYCFGDYFTSQDRLNGIYPWYNYGLGRHGSNPLWSYYRWQNRSNPQWAPNLQTLYQDRYRGTAPRPGRSLAQQTQIIQNIHNNKTINVNQNINTVVNNLTAVTSLTKLDRNLVKLQPVSREGHQQIQQSTQHFRQAAQERNHAEAQVVSKGPVADRQKQAPHAVKFEGPRPARVQRPKGQEPPPLPYKPAPRLRPRQEGRPQPDGQPKPMPEPRPKPTPESKPMPEIQPKPMPKPTPKPNVVPQPEPKPKPRPNVVPEPEPKPRPEIQPKPMPTPEPRPRPQPKPQPDGRPRPQPNPGN